MEELCPVTDKKGKKYVLRSQFYDWFLLQMTLLINKYSGDAFSSEFFKGCDKQRWTPLLIHFLNDWNQPDTWAYMSNFDGDGKKGWKVYMGSKVYKSVQKVFHSLMDNLLDDLHNRTKDRVSECNIAGCPIGSWYMKFNIYKDYDDMVINHKVDVIVE
jgi:hypothetical protein